MGTINGRNASDWIKSAKERQAKGQFDETGAREARQRMQGRQMPEYDKQGQTVIGGSGRTYNFPVPAKAPAKPTPAAEPAPKRETPPSEPKQIMASAPKPESHASPAKAAEPAKRAEPMKAVPNYTERKQQTGIAKAVAEAKKKRDTLKTATVAKPKPEMAADRPGATFWDESTARKAVAEMKSDEAKERAAERESYVSTKRKYTGTTF